MIQETIEKLKVLQEILAEKFRIQHEIEDLPRSLATRSELVSRMKKSYLEKNEKYEATRKRVAEIRVRLQEAEADREKYESQMDQITTAREYDALDKEIREASEREQQYRRDLQREDRNLDEQRQRLEREEEMIKAQETELKEEQARIDQEAKSKKEQLVDLENRESDTMPGLDEELLFKFERIIRSKEGEGIVPIRNGVCTGCQMILPNQFVNDVREASDIHFCPYCSKIVFYQEFEAEQDQTGGFQDTDDEALSDLVDDDFDDDLLDEDDLVALGKEEVVEEEEEEDHSESDDDSDDEDEDEDDLDDNIVDTDEDDLEEEDEDEDNGYEAEDDIDD